MHNTSLSGFEENRQRSFPSLIRKTRCPQEGRAAKEIHSMFLLGFEPRTFRVLGERDDHYTTETTCEGSISAGRPLFLTTRPRIGGMHNTSLSGFEENRQRSFPSLIRMTRCPQEGRAAKEANVMTTTLQKRHAKEESVLVGRSS
uniref:Uncharacterized protein n=1 Tax=Knipowitschia caucasica TaxID=637954 RepID=A0AAV2K7Y0_KNICA